MDNPTTRLSRYERFDCNSIIIVIIIILIIITIIILITITITIILTITIIIIIITEELIQSRISSAHFAASPTQTCQWQDLGRIQNS